MPPAALLPAAERRRAVPTVKLTLAAGAEAVAQSARSAANLVTVFSSSSGDGQNIHAICETLASSEREISPTRFHNSVHNAPAGYWGIATGATAASTALCAYDGSFAAGLLEALTWVACEQTPLLLLAYDVDYPEPLRALRPIPDAFCVAVVLAPTRSAQSLARIDARIAHSAATPLMQTQMAQPELEQYAPCDSGGARCHYSTHWRRSAAVVSCSIISTTARLRWTCSYDGRAHTKLRSRLDCRAHSASGQHVSA